MAARFHSMSARFFAAVIVTALGGIVGPGLAEACSCGGRVSAAAALGQTDLVFVGAVAHVDGRKPRSMVNADGSVRVGSLTGSPVTTFNIEHIYRGGARQQVVIVGDGSNCDVPFARGETWLVYARVRDGRVTTGKCTRTRLRAQAEASQDLAYLEGLERGRQQGVVFGDVLRRIVGADGKPALQALFEPFQVIASGPAGRFQVTTDSWGPYQLVLPPGGFQVWVERLGAAVNTPQTVSVDHGSDRHLTLVVEYRH